MYISLIVLNAFTIMVSGNISDSIMVSVFPNSHILVGNETREQKKYHRINFY
jgi:hypothetical protein